MSADPAESLSDCFRPGGLWSLADVKKAQLTALLYLCGETDHLRSLMQSERDGTIAFDEEHNHVWLRQAIVRTVDRCKQIGIITPSIANRVKDPPQTIREYEAFIGEVRSALDRHLHLTVSPEDAVYYERNWLSETARQAFPAANGELRLAGNAFAADLHTACVFHTARAMEIGTRALAVGLDCKFPNGIENEQLQVVLDQCEVAYKALGKSQRSATKADDLAFYGSATLHFLAFKDAIRVRVAHVRENFTKAQARKWLIDTASFFDHISSRLSEPGVAASSAAPPSS